ncbi:translation initiation factor IF-2-like [Salvia splendens]|uniref:translation initiation factor IF-2-like n=1 Tax=Salvia splendens TaxID=180675 RepID=UPI001C26A3F2|nr:translation initiation factor IF-2-like [Salvia splendens]XP_042050081.1 translation initiation factor IF-2-like [Salvia splendens]XP_042050082.1 translation initiation factor IF-2-like [Salvia splendens]
MPTAEPIPLEAAREEIDLNEAAKKQGLMTDDEFQAILDGVNQREDDTATMVEDLDLTSRAVGEEEPELETPQTEVGESDEHIEEESVPRAEVPEPVAPPVTKPKAVKRKLVLKRYPRAERPKLERVSQRCLRKWASSKANPNTEADPVEILSDEERATPTKPGEEFLPTTDLEDTTRKNEAVSPTLSSQGEEADGMAEALDLASRSVGHKETSPTAQDQFSTQAEKEPEEEKDEDDGEEARYQEERKRKGKALMKKKPSVKAHNKYRRSHN